MSKRRLRFLLLEDAVWIAGGQGISTIVQLVGMRALTELIPARTFGVVSLLLGGITLMATTFCTPFSRAILRFYADVQATQQITLLRSSVNWLLIRAIGLSYSLMAIAGAVYIAMKGSLVTVAMLFVIFAADVIRTAEISYLTAARRQKATALWWALDAISRPVFAIGGVFVLGPTADAVMFGYGVAATSSLAICRWGTKREGIQQIPGVSSEDLRGMRSQLMAYALPLVPSSLVSWVSSLSDRYIIGGILGVTAAGVYSAGYGLVSKPFLMLSTVVLTTLRPVYFDSVAKKDENLRSSTLRTWVRLTSVLGAAVLLLIALCSKEICRLALGPDYQESAKLLPWIGLGYLFVSISYVFNTVSLAHKHPSAVLKSELSGAVASIVVGVPLTWFYGLLGAALSVPVYFLLQMLTAWVLAKAVLKRDSMGT
jgi:O-antigen/teichoic acid export membrane protein